CRGGDNGGAMLVVMEYRNIALLNQRALNIEALRCLDIFQVDTAKGTGDALDSINERLRTFRHDFDIENVNTSETLEQHALAFHDRLGSLRAQVTQTENGRTIGDDGHQVALAGVFVGVVRILSDFAHGLSDTRAVGQRQVARSGR